MREAWRGLALTPVPLALLGAHPSPSHREGARANTGQDPPAHPFFPLAQSAETWLHVPSRRQGVQGLLFTWHGRPSRGAHQQLLEHSRHWLHFLVGSLPGVGAGTMQPPTPPESPIPSPPRPGPLCPPHLPADPQAGSLLLLVLFLHHAPPPAWGGTPPLSRDPVIRGLWSQRNAGSCEPKHDTSPPPTPSPSARPPAAPAGPCPGGGAAPSLLSKPMRPLYVHKACVPAPVTKRGCLALLLMGASRAPRGDKGPPEPRGSGELNSAEEKRTREQNGAESHRTRCDARAIPVTVLKAQYFLSLLLEPNRGCRPAPHRTAGPSPSSPQV